MVQVLLSDVCIEAQVRVVIAIMASPYWEEYWNALNLRHCTFRDVGLAPKRPIPLSGIIASANKWY